MDSVVEFAKLFNERNNNNPVDWLGGRVTSVSPLMIRINGNITYPERKLLVASRLVNQLEIGDQVVLFPTQNYKRAFVADKVVDYT